MNWVITKIANLIGKPYTLVNWKFIVNGIPNIN